MSIGTITLHHTPLDFESGVAVTFDFSQRHEIATGGQTLTGTPTVRVLLAGGASTDLTVTGAAVDATKKLVNLTLSDTANSKVGTTYVISCSVSLSGGAMLVETLDCYVDGIS